MQFQTCLRYYFKICFNLDSKNIVSLKISIMSKKMLSQLLINFYSYVSDWKWMSITFPYYLHDNYRQFTSPLHSIADYFLLRFFRFIYDVQDKAILGNFLVRKICSLSDYGLNVIGRYESSWPVKANEWFEIQLMMISLDSRKNVSSTDFNFLTFTENRIWRSIFSSLKDLWNYNC